MIAFALLASLCITRHIGDLSAANAESAVQAPVADAVSAPSSATPVPAAAELLQLNLDSALAGRTIEFQTDSDVITPAGQQILDGLLPLLSAAPDARLEIEGHTDARGAPDANLALSQRRAEAVRRYLADRGIAADRLTAVGYGATQSLTAGTSPAELRRNRRISFQVK
jgi:outer membrane protein OmpA-like peptidoglycan-associated protein